VIRRFIIPALCAIFCLLYLCSSSTETFHTVKELSVYKSIADTLHEGYNGLFAASGDCEQCHGYDVNGIASVAGKGQDVNVVDDWKTSMMAMSAKDPFWRAKVSHEVLVNPQHQEEIENKCTSCHASLGHFAAFHNGADHYGIEELVEDPWGLDGVSCLSCHQQDSVGLGVNHSGDLHFDTAKVAYGPYESPLTSPMVMETGYWPEYSNHISDAGICAGCHTLITETIDLDGNFIGSTFVEQATYHEWLNSTYDDQDISCQDCHMPNLGNQPIFLIAGLNTAPRQDFSLHEFAGANTFMLELMKENKDTLQLAGSDADFNQSISATFDALQNQSANLSLSSVSRDDQEAVFDVTVSNLVGHKFPSGYPARRLFLQFVVTDDQGEEIFSSGETGENFILLDEEGVEPHYEVIDNQDQVQIYEMAMGDVNGDFTTVLDRGYVHLKDNRLLPIGFSYNDDVIDTVLVHGNAATDGDYVGKGAMAGLDNITYRIPLEGYSGELSVTLRAFYQSIPHKWLEEIFSEESEEIAFFQEMYEAADKTPVLIGEMSIDLENYVGISENVEPEFWSVFYNSDGEPFIQSLRNASARIYTASGSLVHEGFVRAGLTKFPESTPGIYFLQSEETDKVLKIMVD